MSSDLLSRQMQLTQRLENPVKDPLTGSWRERVTGYSPRPGGVRIPSAEDGDGGGQLGVDSARPLPYSVVIGVPGNGGYTVTIDPNLITQAEYDALRATAKSSNELYDGMARITADKQRMAAQPAHQSAFPSFPSRSVFAPAVKQADIATPAPVEARADYVRTFGNPDDPKTRADIARLREHFLSQRQACGASAPPVKQADIATPAPVEARVSSAQPEAYVPDGGPAGQADGKQAELSVFELIDRQMQELAQMREIALQQQAAEKAEAEKAAAARQAPAFQPAGGEPTIAASFVYPDKTAATANYHMASFENDDRYLVLTYNCAEGGKPYFVTNCGAQSPVMVTLRAPSGVCASAEVLSVGVEFPVGPFAVSVFPVVRRIAS